MRIYLARHGQAETDPDGFCPADSGLTETGDRQASELASALSSLGIEMCFTSSLRRARETAQHFERVSGLKAQPIPELREIDFGLRFSMAPGTRQVSVGGRHEIDPSDTEGEDPMPFQRRVGTGFNELVRRADAAGATTIAAFVHGGTVAAVLDHLAGKALDYQRRSRMPNGAYTAIHRTSDGWTDFTGWESSHLTTST